MSDELLKQLETGHDKECAMSYGMHEHCCDCSYVVRQEAAVRIRELDECRKDAERYAYLLIHARRIDFNGLCISDMNQLNTRIDAAIDQARKG